MESLLTQEPKDLDHKNRFFEDMRKKMGETLEYDPRYESPTKPVYQDKKDIAYKVTSREFLKMPQPQP